MATGKSIRIYDLAREVKQDTKRVMEDLRREGADVSVPSNSVSLELAEKVRLKYFPKTEVAPKRGIKVIKAAKKVDSPAEVEETVEHEQLNVREPGNAKGIFIISAENPVRAQLIRVGFGELVAIKQLRVGRINQHHFLIEIVLCVQAAFGGALGSFAG